MPTPAAGESRSDYMHRCVPALIEEGREQVQAVAICLSMWNGAARDLTKREWREEDHPREPTGSPLGGQFTLSGGAAITREEVGRRVEEYETKRGEPRTREVIMFEYRGPGGVAISDEAEIARLRSVGVPPGVRNVRLNPDPGGRVQATWTDDKGRTGAIYSREHAQSAAAAKFARLREFSPRMPQIREGIAARLDDPDPGTRAAARVLYIIEKTGMRIGGTRTRGDVEAFGAATLLGKHVSVSGDRVSFDYVGKHGVRNTKTVTDPTLARIIGEAKTQQWSRPLHDASPGRVRDLFKEIVGGDFQVKDLRTYRGTATALAEIARRVGPAPSEKVFAKWQREVARKVARELGNTPAVALSSYVDFHVWDKWRKPEWGAWLPKKLTKADGGESTDEELDREITDLLETVLFGDEPPDWRGEPSDDPDDEDSEDSERSTAAGLAELFRRLPAGRGMAKHLPGQHDQLDHGHRGGNLRDRGGLIDPDERPPPGGASGRRRRLRPFPEDEFFEAERRARGEQSIASLVRRILKHPPGGHDQAQLRTRVRELLDQFAKYNPWHDDLGRFTSASAATGSDGDAVSEVADHKEPKEYTRKKFVADLARNFVRVLARAPTDPDTRVALLRQIMRHPKGLTMPVGGLVDKISQVFAGDSAARQDMDQGVYREKLLSGVDKLSDDELLSTLGISESALKDTDASLPHDLISEVVENVVMDAAGDPQQEGQITDLLVEAARAESAVGLFDAQRYVFFSFSGSTLDKLQARIEAEPGLKEKLSMFRGFSANYETAMPAFLHSWSGSGASSAQARMMTAAEGLGENVGKRFWNYKAGDERNLYDPQYLPGLASGREASPNLTRHMKTLYKETQAYYGKKFATKSNPNPDLSTKYVTLYRGVGGTPETYHPSAVESWSALKSTAQRFGRMMGDDQRGSTILVSKVRVSDLLATAESIRATRPGWFPEDKELKGKKEHIVLGGGHVDITHL